MELLVELVEVLEVAVELVPELLLELVGDGELIVKNTPYRAKAIA